VMIPRRRFTQNRIGSGSSSTTAAGRRSRLALPRRTLRQTVMVTANPETVSNRHGTSDRLYFEPLTLEDVAHSSNAERPDRGDRPVRRQTPLSSPCPCCAVLATPEGLATVLHQDWGHRSPVIDRPGRRPRAVRGDPCAAVDSAAAPANRLARTLTKPGRWLAAVGLPPLCASQLRVRAAAPWKCLHETELNRYMVEARVGGARRIRCDDQYPAERDRGGCRAPRGRPGKGRVVNRRLMEHIEPACMPCPAIRLLLPRCRSCRSRGHDPGKVSRSLARPPGKPPDQPSICGPARAEARAGGFHYI